MNIKIEKRKVGRTGGSLSLNLTKFLKIIGVKKKDYVWIFTDGKKIIISKNEPNSLKTIEISDGVWKKFLSVVIEEYGEEVLRSREKIKRELEKVILNYVKKKRSFLERTIIRI